MRRECDVCKEIYDADERNLKRGWGLCCSKSCAAKKREMSKPGYNPKKVARNNFRRILWDEPKTIFSDPRGRFRGYSSEGYKIIGNWTYDEFDSPVYCTDLIDMDQHPFDMED